MSGWSDPFPAPPASPGGPGGDWSDWFPVGDCPGCCGLCCDGGCCFPADATVSVTYAIDPTRWASIVANCGDCGGDLADPPGGTFTITGGATVGRGPLGEATIVWQNGAGQQIFYSCLSGWGFVDGASCFFWNSCDGSGDPSGYGGNCCGATGTLVNGFSNGCCPDSAWNDCFNFNEDKPIGATATITVNKNSSGPCP